MTATTSATFAIFIELKFSERDFRVEEFNIEKTATNEQLTVRNAVYNLHHYVEIKRHSIGADAFMREWIKERASAYAYYVVKKVDEDKQIWIKQPIVG